MVERFDITYNGRIDGEVDGASWDDKTDILIREKNSNFNDD